MALEGVGAKLSVNIKIIIRNLVLLAFVSALHFPLMAYAQDNQTSIAAAIQTPLASPKTDALPDSIPLKRQDKSVFDAESSSYITKFAVVFILLICFAFYIVYRKRLHLQKPCSYLGNVFARDGHSSESKPNILSSQRLAGEVSIHVVAWRNTEYLVCCSGDRLTLISTANCVVSEVRPNRDRASQ